MNHGEIISFISGVADLIRDTFRRGKYQDVILPLTVLRRLDCVLAPNKDRVLKRQSELRGKGLQDLDAQLRRASGFAFYNTSRYDFDKLLADAPHLAANLRNYIAGFSPNMREVLEKFDFDNTISKLDEAGRLRRLAIDVSERDLRAIAERGYEGATSTDHDQQAQESLRSCTSSPLATRRISPPVTSSAT